jgi:bleomycin hydrolase
MTDLSPTLTGALSAEYLGDPTKRLIGSILNKTFIDTVTVDPNVQVERTFKFRLDPHVLPVNNQQNSGRCWIFSFTNMIRRKLIKYYKLDPSFNLSTKFILFWDRLEKINALLEVMYFMGVQKGKYADSLEMISLRNGYLSDGGTWAFFVNIVSKYGIVPYEAYPDNAQSGNTGDLSSIIEQFVDAHGTAIRNVTSRNDFEVLKAKAIHACFNTLAGFLGVPPKEVLWKYADNKGTLHEPQKSPCAPIEFYKRFVRRVVNVNDYVVLINDPRHPYDRLYSVELVHNVLPNAINDPAIILENNVVDISLDRIATNIYFNVPTSTMRESVLRSIRANMPVPFAADVSRYMRSRDSRLDTDVHYEDILGFTLTNSRKTLYENQMSGPNHAMLFVGCNGRENPSYEVENSWGVNNTQFPYLSMTDDWFENFVGEIMIHKRLLPHKTHRRYNSLLKKAVFTWYPFWDVLGNLANCDGCKKEKTCTMDK